MSCVAALRHLLGALSLLLVFSTHADESCRIAFDLGSSGIRAGASGHSTSTRADIDYLGPLWAGHGLESTLQPTIEALRDLPEKAGFDAACVQVGGGFSAWRLALAENAEKLAANLARIEAASGVAVLVIPQVQEGAYGYFGARQLLGDGLSTSHVLDIGGGSLQIAGEKSTYGEALGQKSWHRYLCEEIRNTETSPCILQPLTGEELEIARALGFAKLGDVARVLPAPVTMTAISRPVSRGVFPAVRRLLSAGVDAAGFERRALTAAINRIARLTREESAGLVGASSAYVAYLLSDMLLVEALMQATDSAYLQVTELDLTNLPGLLADDRAFAWRGHYACYLERLRSLGLDAYRSDPASCY